MTAEGKEACATVSACDENIMNSLKIVKKRLVAKRLKTAALCTLIVVVMATAVFGRLSKKKFLSDEESGVELTTLSDGKLEMSFSDKTTGFMLSLATQWDDGGREQDGKKLEVEAWYSDWDRYTGKKVYPTVIDLKKDGIQKIVYNNLEYDTKVVHSDEANVAELYSTGKKVQPNYVLLPRLAMNLYLLVCSAAMTLIAIIWFVLRKNKKASMFCSYLFFAPFSFVFSQLVLGTHGETFDITREFILTLFTAAAVYGACVLIMSFAADKKREKDVEAA